MAGFSSFWFHWMNSLVSVSPSMLITAYVQRFNSRMRDELLDGELFLLMGPMKYVVERWRMDYNHYRRGSSLRLYGTGTLCWTVSPGRLHQATHASARWSTGL
ncbi:MAG: hypothetical protein AMJ75_00050 [Phycisphaerae bacterium SM1_79]|nr:MAG: hypothetical protein AMJ75_00050 [Phycisphaerae bacterium SM1_79]